MASRILDMGDLLTLIEQAEKTFDAEQAAKAAAKLQGDGEFTLDDFLEQMQQVRKMGSLTKMLGMLPGMGQFRDQLENFDEREIDRIQAIIQSMTPAERANPKMIDGSRRARIAKGSGRQVSDVNQLVDRFFEARKMMQQMARGGAPGMPGSPGMGLGKKAKGRQAPQQKQAKGKRRSGNPAKRAQEQAAAAEKPAAAAGSRLRARRRGRRRTRRLRPQPAAGPLEVPQVGASGRRSLAGRPAKLSVEGETSPLHDRTAGRPAKPWSGLRSGQLHPDHLAATGADAAGGDEGGAVAHRDAVRRVQVAADPGVRRPLWTLTSEPTGRPGVSRPVLASCTAYSEPRYQVRSVTLVRPVAQTVGL